MSVRLVIGALTFVAGVAHAQDQDVAAWLSRCRARVETVRAAESRLAGLFDEQRALRDAITARKQAGESGGPELKRLLADSLRLEAQLEAGLDRREALRQQTGADCDEGIARAEAELRRLQPGLRAGSMTARRRTAQRIQAVRVQLQALNDLRRVLSPPADDVGLEWSDIPLQIEPLDGPEDLAEKADFVEDARDRLREKRQRLAALYTQARQGKALRRAARDFVTDIQIFDESARSPQTARASAGEASRGPTNEETAGGGGTPGDQTGGPSEDGAGEAASPPAGPVENFEEGFEPGSRGGDTGDGFDLSVGGPIPPSNVPDPGQSPSDGQNPPGAPTGPSAPGDLPAPSDDSPVDPDGLVSGVSPSFLLNLRVEELEDRRLDLDTLGKLLEDMARLDDVLAARAVEMRMKAKEFGRSSRP